MKTPYRVPQLAAHGTVYDVTAIFGGASGSDVLRNGAVVVATGAASINACAEVSGACI